MAESGEAWRGWREKLIERRKLVRELIMAVSHVAAEAVSELEGGGVRLPTLSQKHDKDGAPVESEV